MKTRYITFGVVLLAWMAESGDSLLYSFVMGKIAGEWQLSPTVAASIGFLPLAAAAVGGPIFGFLADRFGRKSSLQAAMLILGLSEIAISLANTPTQIVLARLCVGLMLGGIWSAGMTLVTEICDPKSRGKAIALIQMGFPLGYLYASLLAYFCIPSLGWRGGYAMCALPSFCIFALIVFFVEESPIWKAEMKQKWLNSNKRSMAYSFRAFSDEGYGKVVTVAGLIAFLGMYAYWAVMTWIPSYLITIGFSANKVPLWTMLILLGAIAGYWVQGVVGDRYGRKKALGLFFLGAAVMSLLFGLLPIYMAHNYKTEYDWIYVLIMGQILSFFTGYMSGYGAYYTELFPTRIRASASGFSFNIGRLGTACGPAITGILAASFGMGGALSTASLAFLASAFLVYLLPETAGKKFEAR